MNQVVSPQHVTPFQRAPLAGLLLLFLLLTACFGGGGDEVALVVPETAVQSTGTLVCSEGCLSQGQCGTVADGRIVILARSSGPATRDHDVLLLNDSAVTIVAQEPRIIQDIAGNQTNLNFFAVQPAEGGFTSWVAGSCVNLAVQQ